MKKTKLQYYESPRYSEPINAAHGLYMCVLASESVSPEALLRFVRKEVRAQGYDPDGRAFLGPPYQHGVLSRTYSMWFYQKLDTVPQ